MSNNLPKKVIKSFATASVLSLAISFSLQAQENPLAANPHQGLGQGLGASANNPHQMGSMGASNPHQTERFASGDKKEITWTLPVGWIEQPATSMRLGNFLYTHPTGQKVEILVASLPGPAGGVAANIDMWRSQIGLPKIEADQVLKQTESLKIGDQEMTLVDIVSTENVIENKLKARIVGAICMRGNTSWFFKMKGEDAAVKESKAAFMEFLKSVKFQAAASAQLS